MSECYASESLFGGSASAAQNPIWVVRSGNHGRRKARALDRTRTVARARMRGNPKDPEALFSLTLAYGMQADALSILERKQVESLKYFKEADSSAEKLLAERPDAADAWLALGAAHYIIGCLSGPKRFALQFGGIHGDRKRGMEELTRTASNGRYLKPFAKIMARSRCPPRKER